MVFMEFIEQQGRRIFFIGKSQNAIYEDTQWGKNFGGYLLQDKSGQEISEAEVLGMGIDQHTIEHGKKAIARETCSFFLGIAPALAPAETV